MRALMNRKMLMLLAMGFSGGVPFLLIAGTLKMWLAREHVDVSTIGYFAWVGLAYSLKFLWAPLLDRYALFGKDRRRSWMLTMQVLIAIGLFALGQMNPTTDLALMAALCVTIAFFGATQDIAIDAYRREICRDEELPFGMTMGNYGFRLAMIVTGGLGVGLVGEAPFYLSWGQLYAAMAACMSIGFLTTWFAPEPDVVEGSPQTLISAVVEPLRDFFARPGAVVVLLFVFLYKFGDAMGGAMLTPFYVEMGYSNADIGFIAKIVGMTSSLLGMFVGAVLLSRLGMRRSLWFFGVLQALSTAGFALITFTGPTKWALAATVVFEDVTAGMGNSAFVSFIASVCNRRYTATQFAVFASVAGLGRTFFSGFSGELVKHLGWANFYFACAALAIPGLCMLYLMQRNYSPDVSG